MKTLQKQIDILWRFRCNRCRSQFEMTNAEKLENDRKHNESVHPEDHVHNPMDHFDCPVCGKSRICKKRRNAQVYVNGRRHRISGVLITRDWYQIILVLIFFALYSTPIIARNGRKERLYE